jgi:hypothetical protein
MRAGDQSEWALAEMRLSVERMEALNERLREENVKFKRESRERRQALRERIGRLERRHRPE